MPGDRDGADFRTLLLFLCYVALLAGSVTGAAAGWLPLYASFPISLAAFNLSFTLWHECVHNTVHRSRALCSLIGIITSFLLIYPGYFFLRREHLLHHKYQGDPDRDPVFPRVQCRPWLFPFRLAWTTLRNPQPAFDERRPAVRERIVDGLGYLLWVAIAAGAVLYDLWMPLVFAWALPRLLILPIHAFYVCYLPHSGFGRRTYQVYRIVLRNPFTRYLTLYHSYHGLHHQWPAIPWHRYRKTFQERRQELERKGVEIVDPS